MPQHPMSGPEPIQPVPNATEVLRSRPGDTTFEADLADLAARFAAKSGGGLSPELSADLALEIVLNEVVEQACLATGATGAAIVLEREGDFVCRATSGATAPELGSRMDASSGLSGVCIKTQRTERCDDALTDPRVDVEASQRLGIRSLMVMPLVRAGTLAGLFELFSPLPYAFGERDERTLEVLAGRILNNLERAAKPMAPATPPPPPVEPLAVTSDFNPEPIEAAPEFAEVVPEVLPKPEFDFVSAVLGICVLACAVLLGVLLGEHFRLQKQGVRARKQVPVPAAVIDTPSAESAMPPAIDTSESAKQVAAPSPAKAQNDSVAPGGMRVFDNGTEVFRMTGPEVDGEGGVQRAASLERVLELSPSAAESSLLQRVEPDYPESARQQGIQGAVVLEVRIAANGTVQDVNVISAPEQLAQASIDAVRQWRFRPRTSQMQTRVTLNFRLPK